MRTALALFFVLAMTAAAHACKCGAARSVAALDQSAAAIFRGRVTAIEEGMGPDPLWDMQEFRRVDLIRVTVTKRIKGEVPEFATVVSRGSIRSCGMGGEGMIGRELRFRVRVKAGMLTTHACMYRSR